MNLPRIFANAIARRFAYVLVAAVLSLIGFNARAAAYPDQGSAYAGCLSNASSANGNPNIGQASKPLKCPLLNPTTYCVARKDTNVCVGSSSQWGYEGHHTFPAETSCANRPSATTQFLPLTGSTQCWNGCEVSYRQNADDETSTRSPTGQVCGPDFKENCPVGSFWNGYMGVCQPMQPDCPEGQVQVGGQCKPENKCPEGMVSTQGSTPGAVASGSLHCKPAESECPAGNIKSTSGQCLPGEGQCAAGEAKGKDGTCKRDANNDGKPDSEEGEDDPSKDSASGGDSCDNPPSCNGSAILCLQTKIQWRIDCNTRRNVNIAGGTCDAVPVCTGKKCDAMEYAQLMQHWRTTCAVEKLAKQGNAGGGNAGQGDANGNGVPDVLEGNVTVSDGGEDTDATSFGIGLGVDRLSSENIFGTGSCPQPPSFEYMGATISGADFPYWCDAMAILRGLILVFGAFTAIKILTGFGG